MGNVEFSAEVIARARSMYEAHSVRIGLGPKAWEELSGTIRDVWLVRAEKHIQREAKSPPTQGGNKEKA